MDRVLYASGVVGLGEFRCPPESPLWRQVSTIDGGPSSRARASSSDMPAGTACSRTRTTSCSTTREIATSGRSPTCEAAQHTVARHPRSSEPPDPLFVEETVCLALARVVKDAFEHQRGKRRGRAATERVHHELVEAAKTLLTERTTQRCSLQSVARELHTSEFHLARIFRAATGFTLHRYRTQLRLRLALQQSTSRAST